jgi:integrase/recombinase XerD
MKMHFKSKFEEPMVDMIRFKEALGFSRGSYLKFFLNFDRFCVTRFPGESVLTKEIVMEWARMKRSESSNGLKRRLIAIRQFGKYLKSIGVSAYVVPSDMIGSYKPFIPCIFTDSELNAFFHASDCIPPHRHSPLRELTVPVLFRLLYSCGLRPNEARDLKRANIDLETGTVKIIQTKAHKDRTIVIATDMLKLCRKYDALAGSTISKEREYFFQRSDSAHYTTEWIQKHFRMCWNIAKITEFRGLRPRVYDLRHNYATRVLQKWLDEGRDLYQSIPYLSTYMGHAEFSRTAYYIHLLPERLVRSPAIDWVKLNDLIPEART